MTAPLPYPEARETDINRECLVAWRERGALLVQKCGACDHVFYYPRAVCPACFAPDPAWLSANGTGTIVLATRIHRPNHPSFFDEVPVILAEIALPEGCSLLARVVGPDREDAAPGSAVRLIAPPDHARYPLPTFVLGN
ncbi:MAG: OB-fold domain-containing protein [Alphaproteobacteria bacterium]